MSKHSERKRIGRISHSLRANEIQRHTGIQGKWTSDPPLWHNTEHQAFGLRSQLKANTKREDKTPKHRFKTHCEAEREQRVNPLQKIVLIKLSQELNRFIQQKFHASELLPKKRQTYMRKPPPSKSALLNPRDLQPMHLIDTSCLQHCTWIWRFMRCQSNSSYHQMMLQSLTRLCKMSTVDMKMKYEQHSWRLALLCSTSVKGHFYQYH